MDRERDEDANPNTNADAGEDANTTDQGRTSPKDSLLTAPTVLRFAAFALLLVGFVGIVETDAEPFALESTSSVLFVLGVACAVASIYLGIFRHGRGDD